MQEDFAATKLTPETAHLPTLNPKPCVFARLARTREQTGEVSFDHQAGLGHCRIPRCLEGRPHRRMSCATSPVDDGHRSDLGGPWILAAQPGDVVGSPAPILQLRQAKVRPGFAPFQAGRPSHRGDTDVSARRCRRLQGFQAALSKSG